MQLKRIRSFYTPHDFCNLIDQRTTSLVKNVAIFLNISSILCALKMHFSSLFDKLFDLDSTIYLDSKN